MKSIPFALVAISSVLFFGHSRPVEAQQSNIPPDVQATFTDIDDIDKMRILNPLKLTADQLGKLAKIMKDSTADYNKKIADILVPRMRSSAAEVKDTKRRMLAGAALPKSVDSNIKKMQSDFVAQRKTVDEATIRSLSAQIREVLTDEQYKTVVETTQALTTKDGKKPTGPDDSFFRLYVTGTFIAYGKIVPLLEDMKSARSVIEQQAAVGNSHRVDASTNAKQSNRRGAASTRNARS
jgi:hypothetical protein